MSRRSRRPRTEPRASRGGKAGERKPQRKRRAWLAAAAVGTALAAVAWFAWQPPRPVASDAQRWSRTPSARLADSLLAAERAHQWQRAFSFATELGRREPRNPRFLLMLAQAWNNLAWGGVAFERGRAPLRTSLSRVRAFGQALALLDSASELAQDREDFAMIHVRVGEIYETMGLPIDALLVYHHALGRVPGDSTIVMRSAWVLSQLNDPLLTDEERRGGGRGSRP